MPQVAHYAGMTRAAEPAGTSPGAPDPGSVAPRPPLPSRTPGASPAPPARGRSPLFSKILVILLVGVFVLGSIVFAVTASNARPEPAPSAPPVPALPSAAPAAEVPSAVALADPTDALADPTDAPAAPTDAPAGVDPSPAGIVAGVAPPVPLPDIGGEAIDLPTVDPLASPGIPVEVRMPFVPVIGFWETRESISRADLVAALRGDAGDYTRVLISAGDRDAIAAALGIEIAASVEDASPKEVERALRGRKSAIAVVRASDVTFRMRALGIGDATLFGNERVRRLDGWPLVATVLAPPEAAWDQRRTWTLVAGGDSFTDRGIGDRIMLRNRSLDYPFDGGYATVTGHYCCGPYVTPGHPVPRYRLLGGKGAVRSMVKDADLAILNHEAPVPDDWDFHLHGFIFSGNPKLTEIFTRAGIDWVGLANNHIKDYGADGVVDTRKNLAKYGLKFGGAGKNLREAREFEVLKVGNVRIAIIACNDIAPFSYASRNDGGAAPCKKKRTARDIARADEVADLVIAFPHWGIEYDRDPTPGQRALAAAWAEAGADIILGAHSHVAGGIEEIDGVPVFYSLGNFIFDQNWATYTMESFLLEITLNGDEIVQLRLHPFLSHDQSQPNFLDPAKDDGRALLKAVRRASILDW